MDRRFSILIGLMLILMGSLVLVFTLALPFLGLIGWGWGAWRLWPLIVIGLGLLFVLAPLLAGGKRGLAALFIPGVVVLATGGILLFASVFNAWSGWEWLWPLEVLALAVGFLFAAIYARTIWLLIPAILIGVNGLVLQFCAITGLWGAWAVLWTVEPLSVGLALLVVGARKQLAGLFVAGLILCGLAGLALTGMAALIPQWWLINLVGPVVLVLAGILVLIWSVAPGRLAPNPAGQNKAEAIADG